MAKDPNVMERIKGNSSADLIFKKFQIEENLSFINKLSESLKAAKKGITEPMLRISKKMLKK